MATSTSGPLYNVTSNVTSSNDNVIIYPPEYYNLQSVRDFLRQYYIWIIFAFGFPGNLISLCVIIRLSRHRLATSLFYVAFLAAVDNIAIILKIIENQTRYNVDMAAATCKFLYFFGLTMAAYPNWILIVMSAERFTAVRFPLKVALIWSMRRAVIIIVTVFVVLGCVHAHIFFTITSLNFKCRVVPKYISFYNPWWFLISSSVYAIVPAIVLTIFNILIIIFLRRSSSQRQNLLSGTNKTLLESRRQERQVTVMLVTLAIVFITLTIPRCIFTIVWSYWRPADALGHMRKSFIDALTSNIADSNHAINFYLYFVSGRKFRLSFLEMFRCGRKRYLEVSNGNTQTSELPVAESGI